MFVLEIEKRIRSNTKVAKWYNTLPDEFNDRLVIRGFTSIQYNLFSPLHLSANDYSRKSAIEAGLRIYEQKTCIKWVRRTNERNYVEFMDGGARQ